MAQLITREVECEYAQIGYNNELIVITGPTQVLAMCQTHIAGHVIQRTLLAICSNADRSPRHPMMGRAISARPYVAPSTRLVARHVIDTHVNPRFLGYMASCDVARNICQALSSGGRPLPVRTRRSKNGEGICHRRQDELPRSRGSAWQMLPATSSCASCIIVSGSKRYPVAWCAMSARPIACHVLQHI